MKAPRTPGELRERDRREGGRIVWLLIEAVYGGFSMELYRCTFYMVLQHTVFIRLNRTLTPKP